MDRNDTTHRARVDGREWAERYLLIALAAEEIDEKDFHISLALQLLTGTEASNAAQRGGETRTTSGD